MTVTHPDIIRYFMTIPEAARLVLQAAAIGESGQVMVLDMGDPVKIVDLARDMIRLAGRSEQEIGIRFTGLRPGEKLYEELIADADTTLPTKVARVRIARLGDLDADGAVVEWVREAAGSGEWSRETVVEGLRRWVPEYSAIRAAPGATQIHGR